MSSQDLKTYLAAKYLSGAKADAILARADDGTKRRKKKRKVDGGGTTVVASGGGLIIADDDGMSWAQGANDEDETAAPGASSCVGERGTQLTSRS